MDNNLLSVKETAELLGVSPSSVRKWANLSELATIYEKQTGNRMFDRQEVLEFKKKLQNEAGDLSLIGFGVDKLNKFGNSFQGRLLRYTFVIILAILGILGVYTIYNLQKEVNSLKQKSVENYKVVEDISSKLISNDNILILNDPVKTQLDLDNVNIPKSYGKLILNVDDTLLSILGKSETRLIDMEIDKGNLQNINDTMVEPEFFVENSFKTVDKSTMRDTITGKLYCVLVSNGKLITFEGQCSQ